MQSGQTDGGTTDRPTEGVNVLKLTEFEVFAQVEPTGNHEHRYSDSFFVSISVGRRGLDERGFVVEVHELQQRVKESFGTEGSLGPKPRRRGRRAFVASPEQIALGVARVVYDMLGEDLAEVTVSVTTRTGLATLEWKKGHAIPVFPRLYGTVDADAVGATPGRFTRYFKAFNVTVLLADNFRCGTPEGVDDSFRAEVSIARNGIDERGFAIDPDAFQQAVMDHFHPHLDVGTPDAPRTKGKSRVFVASCEALTRGVAHVAHKMLGENLAGVTVSVQNKTGLVTYAWKAGNAPPTFPAVADQALTDRTYEERQLAIREGRSASSYC